MIIMQDQVQNFQDINTLHEHVEAQDVSERIGTVKLQDMELWPNSLRVRDEHYALTRTGVNDALSLAHFPQGAFIKVEEEKQGDIDLGLCTYTNSFYNHASCKNKRRKIITRATTENEKEATGLERAVIGIPSEQYYLFSHAEALDKIKAPVSTLQVKRARVTPHLMEICVVDDRFKAQAGAVGDIVEIGVKILNSQTRARKLQFGAFTWRLWCTNGCSAASEAFSFGFVHRQGITAINGQIEPGIRDLIEKTEVFTKGLPRLAEMPADDKFIRRIEPRLVQGMKTAPAQLYTEGLRENRQNRLDVWNYVTEYAHKHTGGDVNKQQTLENLGFSILEMSIN